MKSGKNIYQNLARKITINLAQQQEYRHSCEMLHKQNKQLESNIAQLIKELQALTEENQDLKDLVITLNKENEKLRGKN